MRKGSAFRSFLYLADFLQLDSLSVYRWRGTEVLDKRLPLAPEQETERRRRWKGIVKVHIYDYFVASSVAERP